MRHFSFVSVCAVVAAMFVASSVTAGDQRSIKSSRQAGARQVPGPVSRRTPRVVRRGSSQRANSQREGLRQQSGPIVRRSPQVRVDRRPQVRVSTRRPSNHGPHRHGPNCGHRQTRVWVPPVVVQVLVGRDRCGHPVYERVVRRHGYYRIVFVRC